MNIEMQRLTLDEQLSVLRRPYSKHVSIITI